MVALTLVALVLQGSTAVASTASSFGSDVCALARPPQAASRQALAKCACAWAYACAARRGAIAFDERSAAVATTRTA